MYLRVVISDPPNIFCHVIFTSHLLQNEAMCKTFLVKMNFICMKINNHFHVNNVTPSLALKQRFGSTQKWPFRVINVLLTRQNHNYFTKMSKCKEHHSLLTEHSSDICKTYSCVLLARTVTVESVMHP